MVSPGVASRCSSQQAVQFRWFGEPDAPAGKDIEIVMAKFRKLLEGPNRVQNVYLSTDAEVMFKRKLDSAMLGALYPPSEISPVGWNNSYPMFEIRWQRIDVQETQADGELIDRQLIFRMYHSEPTEAPNHFVGHHLHEKDIDNSINTTENQNREISVAVGHYERGLPTIWGISV